MKSLTRKHILALAAFTAFAGASAQAATFTGASGDYGQLVSTEAADQEVKLDASTRWVNVIDGQTVRFEVGGKRFTFNFDTWPGAQQVDLSTIAPKGIAVPNVRVYIAPNPQYMG